MKNQVYFWSNIFFSWIFQPKTIFVKDQKLTFNVDKMGDGNPGVFERVSACDWEEKDSLGRTFKRFSFARFDESRNSLLLFDKSRNSYIDINKNELKFGSSSGNMGLLYKGNWSDGIQPDKSYFENTQQCPFAKQSK